MPPAAGSNSTTNAAVQAAAKAEKEERLRGALKAFILKERQRKKEEYQAKLEQDRQRKEREARERQNDMTLEETRGQITKLEQKLTELQNQKQQLFLQLKKVLNEDENRKKQQKDNEMYAMQALQAQAASAAPQPQVFLPPKIQQHTMPVLTKPPNNPPVKRGRSPSPTQPGYYKQTNYNPPKHDERRAADSARVLWNKPHSQYQTPGTLFYQTTSNPPPPPQAPTAPAIIYTQYNLPLRQGYHLELPPTSNVPTSKPDSQGQKPTQVYHINLDQPPNPQSGMGGGVSNSVQAQKPQITMEKITDRYHEVKHEGPPSHGGPPTHQLSESVVYMPLHPNVMQISGGAPPPNSKPGSGYAPVRNASGHETQMGRQQQITVMTGQPGQQPQQQLHYPRRMF
ncbi:serine/arginine repetitive matrix protein 1 [Stomoxys calcitrans]|uniref:G protein pathway suppressor 2 n=1 Tax=Stomoxys calcitrans TaxID=35570 RepID=A0A1I8PM18_STOCA|nr:serine/arginine repetitive matrix protein 1 [Stomoxys calcitrans]